MSPLKLDRRSRALCRKLFQHGWKRDRLAEELQCSQTTIKRVLDREENKYHDDFSDGVLPT
jgi:AraC-like DNA-binding protein